MWTVFAWFAPVHALFTPVPRSESVFCPATKGSRPVRAAYIHIHAPAPVYSGLQRRSDVYSERAMESSVNVWRKETEMLFLEHYHSENVLWDAKNPHHKDKNKNHDAWRRISTQMNLEIKELKKKKDSLMSSYRLYRKKVRDSNRSGAGAEEIYKPIWFAYAYMDSFLGEGLTVKKATDTLNQESNVHDSQENNQENVEPEPPTDENPTTTKRRRNNPPELQQAGSFIKESLANLNRALCRNNHQEKEDDYDRYGKILANKLRQLPEDERLIFMHDIDGMFIQRRRRLNDNHLSSPILVSSPSPAPTPNILQCHQQNTSRSGSSFCSYSEPISLYRTYYDSNHDNKMARSEEIINDTHNITQYPPVIHLPEQSNTNTRSSRIRMLSNEMVSPSASTRSESFSQSEYEYSTSIIADAYEKA